MIGITLVCAAGMSTSLLVTKMEKAAEEQGKEVKIRAIAESDFERLADETDVLLLGPQVRFKLKNMEATYVPKGIKVALISSIDYGRMNGEAVLKAALDLYES